MIQFTFVIEVVRIEGEHVKVVAYENLNCDRPSLLMFLVNEFPEDAPEGFYMVDKHDDGRFEIYRRPPDEDFGPVMPFEVELERSGFYEACDILGGIEQPLPNPPWREERKSI